MGKVIDIEAELRKDNKSARQIDIAVYADALRSYVEAARNVTANGAICTHPRTGAPIENPYLKIQSAQGKALMAMRAIKGDRVLKMLQTA